MAFPDTKQKILEASLQLFNQNGISNVRLQQIADEAGISVGNLAYHFNNKEAITECLITKVIDSLQELLRHYGKYASLKDLDFFFSEFYQLCNQHSFFNIDIFEIKRNFPAFYDLLKPLFNKVKLQLERHFDLCLQQRLLSKEADLKTIASHVWLLMFFIQANGQLSEKELTTENSYRKKLWDYIRLHFTEKGKDEYAVSIEPELSAK